MVRRKARVRPTRDDTRQRVIDGAEVVFGRRGFGGAAIDEICREADLTRGAFYSSFTSKDDLFFALYDRMLRRVEERFANIATAMKAGTTGVPEFVSAIVAAYPVDRNWFLLFTEFNLHAIRHPAVAVTLAEHRARMLDAITAVIDQLLGAVAIDPAIDTRKVARLILAIHEGNFSQSEIEPDQIAHGELLQTFCPIIARGLLLDPVAPSPERPTP